jgi:hypothetical protein
MGGAGRVGGESGGVSARHRLRSKAADQAREADAQAWNEDPIRGFGDGANRPASSLPGGSLQLAL